MKNRLGNHTEWVPLHFGSREGVCDSLRLEKMFESLAVSEKT